MHHEGPLLRNFRAMLMVWRRDIIRLFRMPTRIITGIAQPILFLFVLGAGLESAVGANGAAGVDYQQYLFPGILAMSVLTSALFSAIAIVWDREFGFLREMLVAPVRRSTLVLGKALGGGSVSVIQGLVLVVLAPIVGVSFTVASFFEMLFFLLLLAFSLTAFGIVVASRMQRMESFQMVMALVLQPMLFLSGAIFPLNALPKWLAVITRLNPATYGVDAIRRVILPQAAPLEILGSVVPLWFDALVTLGFGVAMLALAVKLFGKTE
ncbi:MAG: ABC transporter permease [Acidimicrobiia bacterium]|nr:ABC transporter permease [Acidimicrobiia bacterium]MSV40305.1 ABC transporter permease subunit [Actinomycetota bacterium]MSV94976.1 ABC transporter permease subunit [Actinomycetota bacterium]MSW60780.1 ABC transporter permease subunit [Actinomycetota bacterium]MSY45519.1 ABC transporter permease subunit [Actinomycetota bacterium]